MRYNSRQLNIPPTRITFFSTEREQSSQERTSLSYQEQRAAIEEMRQDIHIKEKIGHFLSVEPDNLRYFFVEGFDDGENRPSPAKIHLVFENLDDGEHERIMNIFCDYDIRINGLQGIAQTTVFIYGENEIYQFLSMVTQSTSSELSNLSMTS